MRCDRRGFLIVSGLMLAGCGTGAPSPGVDASRSTAPEAISSNVPTQAEPAIPTREQVIQQLAAQQPTEWGLDATGVVQRAESSEIGLTLDACGGPTGSGVDQQLINLLITTQTPATLFINSRWIDRNEALTKDLIAHDLFCIANHGTRHVPLSATGQSAYGIPGTASIGEAYDEVMGNQARLTDLMGEAPKFFRPGTAYLDDVCAQLVRMVGLLPIGFDVNTDAGATFSTSQVTQATLEAGPGSICIGHVNQPDGSTYEGLAVAIPQLKAMGHTFARLDAMVLA